VDGSTIVGEVVTANNGTRTVKTSTVGTITLKDSDVRPIRPRETIIRHDASGESTLSQQEAKHLGKLQQRIPNDPSLAKPLEGWVGGFIA
jgi:hypothetical protein